MLKVLMMLMSNYGFEFGNLELMHPSENFYQLKARRESNYQILKSILEAGNGNFNMPARRLEVSIPTGSQIQNDTITIRGINSAASEIVVWPFVPIGDDPTKDKLITARYGDVHNITNVTIKSPVKNIYYETYDCVLRKGGVANAIEITGVVRPEFWAEMVPGKKIWYSWSLSVLGEKKFILSVDQANSIIYTTTNITAAIASNTAGDFGTSFKEDISQADFVQYGAGWYINNTGIELIGGSPAAASGADYILNLHNAEFENTSTEVTLSMGTAKVNISGQKVAFRGSGVAFSFFVRGVAGGQKVTVNAETELLMEDNGYPLVGGILAADSSGIYGAGGYLHDSVIVECNGTLHLKNNLAASWRQYSSGYNLPNVGINYYANIIEEGSGEYCLLTSNVTPTIIDNIECSAEVWLRHNTIINGGDIDARILSYGLDFGIGVITAEFNNVTFRSSLNLYLFDNIDLNDCDYYLPLLTDVPLIISPSIDGDTNINGGTIYRSVSVGTWNPATGVASGLRGSNFISNYGQNITIDGIVFNDYPYMYLFDDAAPQQPYTESTFSHIINNVDLKCYAVWLDAVTNTAGTLSHIFEGTNTIVRNNFTGNGSGKYFIQNIGGLTGTVSKSIVAAKTYSILGALTNILEIDFEHDHYETSGTLGAIVATNPWANSYSSNPIYGRNIRVYAVGGNVTLSTFDSVLRPTSNIIGVNGTVIPNGGYLDFTINRGHVFQTGTAVANPTVATGNGATKNYHGVLPDFILDPTVIINVTAGGVNVNADANGNFSHADVVGLVDYWTGKYHFIFTNNVPNLTPIVVTYNKPNVWKNTGAWVI